MCLVATISCSVLKRPSRVKHRQTIYGNARKCYASLFRLTILSNVMRRFRLKLLVLARLPMSFRRNGSVSGAHLINRLLTKAQILKATSSFFRFPCNVSAHCVMLVPGEQPGETHQLDAHQPVATITQGRGKLVCQVAK